MKKLINSTLLGLLASFLFTGILMAQPSGEEIQMIKNIAASLNPVEPKQEREILVFNLSEGFQHSCIPYAAEMLKQLAEETGAFKVTMSTDYNDFLPENLEKYDAVVFNNTTQLKFDDQQWRDGLLEFIKGGKGIIGIHAATDNFYDWPEGAALIGGLFDGHPWTSDGEWVTTIEEPNHPLNKGFSSSTFVVSDEIYRVKNFSRADLRVLISLDLTSLINSEPEGIRRTDLDVPISWIRGYGEGRLFYCSFGHNHDIYWNREILTHYLAGIQYALGDLPADDEPSLEVWYQAMADFTYYKERTPFTMIDVYLRSNPDSVELHQEVEGRLVEIIQREEVSLDAKQMIAERLGEFGSALSVPALTDLLLNPETADIALLALERISDPEAAAAMASVLEKTDGLQRAGILSTLGVRREEGAVDAVAAYLTDDNADVVVAAAAALGEIGGAEAADALLAARDEADKSELKFFDYALLSSADKMREEGKTEKASEIYGRFYPSYASLPMQVAGLIGLIKSATEEAGQLIVDALKSDVPAIRSAAITSVSELQDVEQAVELAGMLSELEDATKLQLITSFKTWNDPAVRSAVIRELESDDAAVKAAALETLSQIGTADEIMLLAAIAAEERGTLQRTARQSLLRLNAEGVTEAVIEGIENSKGKIKAELILVAGERVMLDAADAVLASLDDEDSGVRRQAARVMSDLARPQDTGALVEAIVNAESSLERDDLVIAAAVAARQKENIAERGDEMLEALDGTEDVDIITALLEAVGRTGDPDAYDVLVENLNAEDTDLQRAAVKALAEWPDHRPLPLLWEVAETSEQNAVAILALRGVVNLLELPGGPSPDEKAEQFEKAFEMAPNTNEKRLVLSGLSTQGSLKALQLAVSALEDSTLMAEAVISGMKIGVKTTGNYSAGDVLPLLLKLREAYEASGIIDWELRAQLFRTIEAFDAAKDYIMTWQVAGPYTGPEEELFEKAFPPETDPDQVEWDIISGGSDKNIPCNADLLRRFGGEFKVAYVRVNVIAEEAMDVQLEIGSDDGNRTWLNGELVNEVNYQRGVAPGDDVVEVSLKEGVNELLIKVHQQLGNWGVCARFRTMDGLPVSGLEYVLPGE